MAGQEKPVPSEEEVRKYFETCSNWGRGGPDHYAAPVN